MYLLNINTMRLERVGSTDSAPEYAILSHTWSQDIDNPELVFADWNEESQKSARAAVAGDFREMLPSGSAMWKLVGFCKLARALSLDYVWIDTLCIDQRSSAELSEAINAMWMYYRQSMMCIAFVSERWYDRGWTLQELLAPRDVMFYDDDWRFLGTRIELAPNLSSKTGIPQGIFLHGYGSPKVENHCVAEKFSWASKRVTTRPEDKAYSLMGLFGVNMPILYGEGFHNAFHRLQVEVFLRLDDYSIFLWWPFLAPKMGDTSTSTDIFARDLQDFAFAKNFSIKTYPHHQDYWDRLPRRPELTIGLSPHRSGLQLQLATVGVDSSYHFTELQPAYHLAILPFYVAEAKSYALPVIRPWEFEAKSEVVPVGPFLTIILKSRSQAETGFIRHIGNGYDSGPRAIALTECVVNPDASWSLEDVMIRDLFIPSRPTDSLGPPLSMSMRLNKLWGASSCSLYLHISASIFPNRTLRLNCGIKCTHIEVLDNPSSGRRTAFTMMNYSKTLEDAGTAGRNGNAFREMVGVRHGGVVFWEIWDAWEGEGITILMSNIGGEETVLGCIRYTTEGLSAHDNQDLILAEARVSWRHFATNNRREVPVDHSWLFEAKIGTRSHMFWMARSQRYINLTLIGKDEATSESGQYSFEVRLGTVEI